MATLPLTYAQLHVVLDALTRHAIGIDTGEGSDPTHIYEGGVFPATHPLRILPEYRVLCDELLDTFNDALGAAGEESTIDLVIAG